MTDESAISTATERDLNLPKALPFKPAGSSTQYGVNTMVARYCGLPPYRECPLPGIWQHGSVPTHWQQDPRMVYQDRVVHENTRILVAREDERQYLGEHGFHNTKAIGLPITYLPTDNGLERRERSLLVMPMHSRDSMTRSLNFADYTKTLSSIIGDFDCVVGCIHPACLKHGYWLEVFRELGVPMVLGAGAGDQNALYRMQALLSQFEFVTSNGFGSHHAYAAHFGAKPSIVGTLVTPQRKDYANSFFYVRQPELLEIVLEINSEPTLRREYEFLFKEHPGDAEDARSWGHDTLGATNRLDPGELASELGTSATQRWWRTSRAMPKLLKSRALGRFRAWQRMRARRNSS